MRYLVTFLILSSVILFSGCKKEQGCTNPQACNFSQSAEEDDGSCYFPEDSCDDNDYTTYDDSYNSSCDCIGILISFGCTDNNACNYIASANTDNGSCAYPGDSCDDGNRATGNDTWSNSCSCEGGLLGCTISSACNYNSDAEIDDDSCAFVGDSCDDGNPYTANDVWSNSCVCEGDLCEGDIYHDGYEYSIIQIGEQCWFSENCRYLPEVSPSSEGTNTGPDNYDDPYYYVYGYVGNDVAAAQATTNYATYGVMYNWIAVMTEGICPSGWHIPSDGEFTQLTDFLGGESVAGGKMKEAGYDHWNSPNTGATNSSGFTFLPGGIKGEGDFSFVHYVGYLWSSSDYASSAWMRGMDYGNTDATRGTLNRGSGMYARCVRD